MISTRESSITKLEQLKEDLISQIHQNFDSDENRLVIAVSISAINNLHEQFLNELENQLTTAKITNPALNHH